MPDLAQIYREKVRKLAEPIIESEDMELIDVECLRMKSRWIVRIYIDKEGGITLDDCSEISNQVGDLLGVHEAPPGSYILEVSSPGLNRLLTREKDFIKYRGYKIKVKVKGKVDGKRSFRGKLVDFQEVDGREVLVIEAKRKIYHLPREIVDKANLDYEIESK